MIQLYDSLRRRKVEFVPLEPNRVGIYVCGPTVYDVSHVGHARAYVAFDVIVRYLKYKGYDVMYVRNITDVDDKIINRANEAGEDPLALSNHFARAFNEDMALLGNLEPQVAPRVSTHIAEIIGLIEKILQHGNGYVSSGDVYFAVDTFPGYGGLSGRKLDDLRAGARVEVNEQKRNPLDFVLWKSAKTNEPAWPSPWGPGRPGWHIECSAMSSRYLGDVFDIHGGGMDLIFPHHENEIAQSCAASGQETFARYWLHNGFVNVRTKDAGEEKMSKSLGNFFTIREVCQHNAPEALRLFLLSTQYRNPINFEIERKGGSCTFRCLEETAKRLAHGYSTLQRIDDALLQGKPAPLDAPVLPPVDTFMAEFESALDDDFNTAAALGLTSDLLTSANKLLDQPGSVPKPNRRKTLEQARQCLNQVAHVLGVFGEEPRTFLERRRATLTARRGIDPNLVQRKIRARAEARLAKNFAEADTLRNELVELGVELMDRPGGGTDWRIVE
jgi:cysteinyl-tRNA synthetase